MQVPEHVLVLVKKVEELELHEVHWVAVISQVRHELSQAVQVRVSVATTAVENLVESH